MAAGGRTASALPGSSPWLVLGRFLPLPLRTPPAEVPAQCDRPGDSGRSLAGTGETACGGWPEALHNLAAQRSPEPKHSGAR